MNRIIRLFFLFLILPVVVFAQNEKLGKNTWLSLEAGGLGLIASANIGQTLFANKRYKIIAQAGIGYNPDVASSSVPINFPFQITNCFGNKTIRFEAGLGATCILKSNIGQSNEDIRQTEIYLSPLIGFRHESERWFAKIYTCPSFHLSGNTVYNDLTRKAMKVGLAVGLIL